MKRLDSYIELVHFLGSVLPKHYEIVLQDVSTQSILALENGHVSGRQVGSPMTDYSLRVLSEGSWKTQSCRVNYDGRTSDGRRLRSSTWFIRDGEELLAMLCINVDVQQYDSLSRAILSLGGLNPEALWKSPESSESAAPIEQFHSNIGDMTRAVISDLVSNVSVDRLTQDEKLAVVAELDSRGTFLMKGAVSDVAAQLSCSEASIYRYLNMIRQEKNKE